jgi:hypothetical protein
MKKPLLIAVVAFYFVLIFVGISLFRSPIPAQAQLLPVECRTRLMEATFPQGTPPAPPPNCGIAPETMTITMAVVDDSVSPGVAAPPIDVIFTGGHDFYWGTRAYGTMSADNSGTPCPNYTSQLGVQVSAPLDFISVLIVNAKPTAQTITATTNLGAVQQFTMNGNGSHQFMFSGGHNSISFTSSDPAWRYYADYVHFTPQCPLISAMEFIALNSALDSNPNASGGQRIFPDKQTPSDTVDRKKVRIKATTRLGANKTIYFKAFDIDDPSTDFAPVDPNSSAGNDNRGTPQAGTFTAASAITDSNGIAQLDFSTTMQPGDNFVIAASDELAYLNGIVIDGIILRDSANKALPTSKANGTPMLTVWRNLHIEIDSMGLVAANRATGKTSSVTPNTATNQTAVAASTTLEVNRFQNGRIILNNVGIYSVISNTANSVTVQGIVNSVPRNTNYTLYDDDDFNSNDGVILDGDVGEDVVAFTQTLSLMQKSDNPLENVFAPAYIRPIYDGGGSAGNDTSNIAFSLNIPLTTTAINTQLNGGRNSGANESDNFWVVYLQMGYQGDLTMDIDPGTEPALGGATTQVGSVDDVTGSAGVVIGGQGSLVFVEGSRDGDITIMIGDDFKLRTAPHEVGHQFGLRGDAAGFGIMSQSTSGEPLSFVDRHLNVLRWRVKSPGQP